MSYPPPTLDQRLAAGTVAYLVATRKAATDALQEQGANSVTLTGLRASAEAIASKRTSWDDLPAENWVAFTACLLYLACSEHLTPGEREAAAELAQHYHLRALDAPAEVVAQLDKAAAELAKANQAHLAREGLAWLDERLGDDPAWQAARQADEP